MNRPTVAPSDIAALERAVALAKLEEATHFDGDDICTLGCARCIPLERAVAVAERRLAAALSQQPERTICCDGAHRRRWERFLQEQDAPA